VLFAETGDLISDYLLDLYDSDCLDGCQDLKDMTATHHHSILNLP
jgi:hypothetical protein